MICEKCGNEKIKYGTYACGACRALYFKNWQAKNRAYVNANSQAWTAANKALRKEILKRSHIKNREDILSYKREYYAANKEKYREYDRTADPLIRKGIKYRYRARKQANGIEKYSVAKMFERDNHTCAYCGDVAKELDHITPVSRGGSDSPSNVAASCVSCNRRKAARTATEFMRPLFKKISKQLEMF